MLDKIKRLLCLLSFSTNLNIKIKKINGYYEISKNDQIIKISSRHRIYIFDIVENFDYYFSAVEPTFINGISLVDYSGFSSQIVKGYSLHKIIFPSIPEPIETTEQYLQFANLHENSIVIDLGAYSGLTSLIFDRKISESNSNAKGKVIAVEADIFNFSCLIQNIQSYKFSTNRNIEVLFSAISNKNGFENFLADGAMGANSNFTGLFRQAQKIKVPSLTLNSLAERYKLDRVDFIKCDIEGAEKYIFEDDQFFKKFSPKIIIEAHLINNTLTTDVIIKTLEKYNYNCKLVKQIGSILPLIECVRE
jgi:FkbM family methyltransferase